MNWDTALGNIEKTFGGPQAEGKCTKERKKERTRDMCENLRQIRMTRVQIKSSAASSIALPRTGEAAMS